MSLKDKIFYIDESDFYPRKRWCNDKVYYKADVDEAVAELKKRGTPPNGEVVCICGEKVYLIKESDFDEVLGL